MTEYNAEPGYITMNMPKLLDFLNAAGIYNPIICTSINVDGFRMSGGKALYEKTLNERDIRVIAMQVLSGGASKPKEALSYVCNLPNIQSILFGASSKSNIRETVSFIREFDYEEEDAVSEQFNHIKIY
jgi:phosphoribosylformimino-5-aminoimidazole carboxamide ribonucleotide (ProFAR) isomerase